MSNTIGAKIVLDGEKEYREALKNINTEQKELRSELKLASSAFDGQQNSIQALTEKHEILTRQIENQKEKIEIYAKAVGDSASKQEDAGQKVSTLSEALEKAQKEMEEMSKASDVSKEALDGQQKKIDDLARELETANKEYDTAVRSTNNWKTALNNAQTDLNNMNGNLKELDKYIAEAEKSTDGCATSIDEYGKKIENAGETTTRFGDVLKANVASEVIIAGITKLKDLVGEVGEELLNSAIGAARYADDIMTMSVNTGIAADTLQEITYAQELMDVSLETVTSAMAKNIKSMDSARKGSEDYAKAYETLGIRIQEPNGKLKDSETIFWKAIDAMKNMRDETDRDAISMQLFGRKAQDLNSLISIGSEGFKELAQEAHDTGFVLSDDIMQNLLKTSDAMERMKNRIAGVKNSVGAELAPVLEESFDRIGDAVENAQDDIVDFCADVIPDLIDSMEWILNNSDAIAAGIGGIATAAAYHATVGPAIQSLTDAWKSYKTTTEGATIAQWAMNAAQNASPAGLLVTAIVGLTSALGIYAIVANDATSGTDELNKKIQRNIEERAKESAELQTNAVYARTLAEQLTVLSAKESLTATEQYKVRDAVEQLNEMYPQLNLTIDENTGKLQQNTEELKKNLEQALENEKLTALEEKYADALHDSAEAEANLLILQDDIRQKQEELNKIDIERNKILDEYTIALQENAEYSRDFESEMSNLTAREVELNAEIDNLTSRQAEYKQTIQDTEKEVEQYNRLAGEQLEVVEEIKDSTDDLKTSSVEYKGQMYEVTEEVAESIATLEQAYANAKTTAIDSISSQVGLFDELSVKSEMTVSQMRENLDSQTQAFNQYSTDLENLKNSSNEKIQSIVQQLADMGMEGAGYVHELANATDQDIDEIVKSFEKVQEAKDKLGDVMADIQSGYSEQMDEWLGIQSEKMELYTSTYGTMTEEASEILAAAGEGDLETVQQTMEDMKLAVDEGAIELNDSVALMCDTIYETTIQKLQIVEGKSLVYQQIGKTIPVSMAQGVKDGTSEFVAAIEEALDKAVEAAVKKAKKAAKEIDKALGSAIK